MFVRHKLGGLSTRTVAQPFFYEAQKIQFCQISALRGLHIRAVAVGTLRGGLLIDDNRLVFHQAHLGVTFVTSHLGVSSLQGKMSPRVVIEDGGNPPLRIVTIGTGSFAGLHKLACMGVFVAILTNLRRALELHLFGSRRHLVAITALYSAMRAKERKLRFRVVVATDVGPRSCVVASFAAQSCAVSAALGHPLLKFAVMGVLVTRSAAHVHEMERQDFIRAAGSTHPMAIGARHGGMRAGQSETRVAMLGNRKRGAMEILNRVATLTLIFVGRGGKLPVVGILMTVHTVREFDFVNRFLAGRNMALGAFYFYVLSFQRIL